MDLISVLWKQSAHKLPLRSPLIRKVGREVRFVWKHKIKFGCESLEVNLKDFGFYREPWEGTENSDQENDI